MKKIFEEYGGTIITVVAVVLMVSFVTLSVTPGGALYSAFGEMIDGLSAKANSMVNGEDDSNGGSVEEIIYTDFTITADNRYMIGYTDETTNLVIPKTFEYDGTWYRVVGIDVNAFSYCSGLTSVSIPDGVTAIGAWAFVGCTSLSSVTIPDSVTSIGEFAFCLCSGLTSITIPDGITSIVRGVFGNCSSLTSIVIPDNVTYIGESAFDGCSGLTSITIPDDVTHIGVSAFSACSSLTSIIIPDSVTYIDQYAFSDCTGLDNIIFAGTMAQWNVISFGTDWHYNVPATFVQCSDGKVSLN